MEDLVKIALAGTNRAPFDGGGNERAAVRVAALASGAEGDSARTLLLACGTEAVYRAAGYRPRKDVPPLPAAPEDRPFASARVAEAAEAWFSIKELAAQLARAGLLVPRELLPRFLAVKEPDLRAALMPVLGHRGRWLASLDDSTAWATAPAGPKDSAELRAAFEEGTIDERVVALAEMRATDPAQGLRWLVEVFKTEKADNRQRLIAALATGASLDDEDFLEATLRDRSSLVGAAAADVLRGLAGSKLLARLRERADEVLLADRDAKGELRLRTRLPDEIPIDWKRDFGSPLVLPEKSPKWSALLSLFGAIPPTYREARFSATPDELIAAIAQDHFGDAVLCAWATPSALGQLSQADRRRWRDALFAYASELDGVGEKRTLRDATVLHQLSRTLEDSDLEAWLGVADHLPARALPQWFATTRTRLGELRDSPFGSRVVEVVRRRVEATSTNDLRVQWAGLLEMLVHAVAFEDMPAALAPWALPEADTWHTRHVVERVESFLESLRRRRRLIEAIAAEATTDRG